MVMADCPACNAKINLGYKPKLGQRAVCSACDTELEVVWLEPVELDWPYDEYEDDEYDEYDETDFEEEPY